MKDKVKAIMADILDIDVNDITDSFGPEDTDSWDSIRNLQMITALEKEFRIQFTMDDIEKMANFTAIFETVHRYTG